MSYTRNRKRSAWLGNRSGLAYCYWNWGLLAREQHDRKTEREKLAAALDQAERGKRSQW